MLDPGCDTPLRSPLSRPGRLFRVGFSGQIASARDISRTGNDTAFVASTNDPSAL
jgi:hypothetical protein